MKLTCAGLSISKQRVYRAKFPAQPFCFGSKLFGRILGLRHASKNLYRDLKIRRTSQEFASAYLDSSQFAGLGIRIRQSTF
jgi:hypothetical protein